MATQTVDAPLNVVLLDTAQAPSAQPHHELDLHYYGGKTLSALSWRHVYVGSWDPGDVAHLDRAVPAALTDAGLNNVLAQQTKYIVPTGSDLLTVLGLDDKNVLPIKK